VHSSRVDRSDLFALWLAGILRQLSHVLDMEMEMINESNKIIVDCPDGARFFVSVEQVK